MKKGLLSVFVCIAVLLFIGCESDESEKTPSVGTVAEYDGCKAELLDSEINTLDDGSRSLRVNIRYTNRGTEGMYMLESFLVKAFQDDMELNDVTDINDDESSADLIVEVKDGASVTGSYVFELTADTPVEVTVSAPTAEEELLARKEYSF